MDTLTPELAQLLELLITAVALIVPTVGLTDFWKWAASRIESLIPFTEGLGARIVSWIVAALVIGAGSMLGYVEAESITALWGIVSLLSNAAFDRLYRSQAPDNT